MGKYLKDRYLNSVLEDYFNEGIKDKDISKKNFEFDGAGIYIKYYKKEYDDIYQKTFEAIKKNYDDIKRKVAKLIIKDAKEHNKENEYEGWQAPIPSENELYKCLTINSNYKNKKFDLDKTSKKYPSFINCKYNDNKGRDQDPSIIFIHLNFYGEKVPCNFEIYYYYYPEKDKLKYDSYIAQY